MNQAKNISDCPTRARFKSNLGHFLQLAFNLDIRPKDEREPEIKQHVRRWNEFRHCDKKYDFCSSGNGRRQSCEKRHPKKIKIKCLE
jgi:hypothetical protein